MIDGEAIRFAHAVLTFDRDEAAEGASPFAVLASVMAREPWSIPYAEAWPLVGAALRTTERGNP